MSGHVEREGNSVRFELHEMRSTGEITFSGRFAYKSPRGRLPETLSIVGWTLFRDSVEPERGERSRFATLGELEDSEAHRR